MIDLDLDRPRVAASADVTLVSRGLTVTATVEAATSELVVVRPIGEVWELEAEVVETDDPAELYWVGAQEEWSLTGAVQAVENDGRPRWHIAVDGPAERSQRRKAVRARVEVPVQIPWAGSQMMGRTVDLSESGMRAMMDGWGVPLDPGTPSQLTLTLDDALIHLHGAVVWTSIRGARWLMAMRFVDVPDDVADRLRRRVFQALRDERAQTAD